MSLAPAAADSTPVPVSPTCRATNALTRLASTPKLTPTSTAKLPPIPELIQIENGYRAPKEQRPGALSAVARHREDRHHQPKSRRRTRSSLRVRKTRHHRLRQARRNHPHRLHRQQLPCPRSPRRCQSRGTPRPGHAACTPGRNRGRGRGTESSSTRSSAKPTKPSRSAGPRSSSQQQEQAGAASTRQHRPNAMKQRKARQATFDRIIAARTGHASQPLSFAGCPPRHRQP